MQIWSKSVWFLWCWKFTSRNFVTRTVYVNCFRSENSTQIFSNKFILLYWISVKYTNAKLLSRFEANRCGCHGGMAKIITFQNFVVLIWQSRFRFSNSHRYFPRNYPIVIDFNKSLQLMCKFEANQCGFHDAIYRPFR